MQINYLDLSFTNMRGCDLSHCQAIEVRFAGANLSNCIFNDATLKQAIFRDAVICGSSFERANLSNCEM